MSAALDWYECGCCGGLMIATEPGLCATCEEGEKVCVSELEEPLTEDATAGGTWSSLMSTIDELIGEKTT